MKGDRVALIRDRLQERFEPEYLDVEDESHLHEGHAGTATGLGHFRVTIVSAAFEGMGRIQRHRVIYEALGPLMQSDIHALAIKAATPEEI